MQEELLEERSQIHLEVTTKCKEFYLFSHYNFLQVWPLCNDYRTSLKEILTGKNYFLMICSCIFLPLPSPSIVVRHYWSIYEAAKMHLYWIVSERSLSRRGCSYVLKYIKSQEGGGRRSACSLQIQHVASEQPQSAAQELFAAVDDVAKSCFLFVSQPWGDISAQRSHNMNTWGRKRGWQRRSENYHHSKAEGWLCLYRLYRW